MKALKVNQGLRSLKAGAVALLALTVLAGSSGVAAADGLDPHGEAMKALTDIEAVTAILDQSSKLTESGFSPYKKAGHRALNALVGRDDPVYDAGVGQSADPTGAIPRLQWLRDHADADVWGPAIEGAWVNAMIAKSHLKKAVTADELGDFQSAVSRALQSLVVALGSETETGGLAGLKGALSMTDLAVPADARVVDGCMVPPAAPAYGVAGGYLTYVALPSGDSSVSLPTTVGIAKVSFEGGAIELRTAALEALPGLCGEIEKTVDAADGAGESDSRAAVSAN
ncbi:MAG: hypothetical protein CMM50_09825 [Rhodospirillaceae bacterium]|nr:hypothetical protein [Rhodospirillaceae bacterium]|tara:strand:- start:827 stop:1678 length:852 start_codon:yes stop_codon:yes gene_type:complete